MNNIDFRPKKFNQKKEKKNNNAYLTKPKSVKNHHRNKIQNMQSDNVLDKALVHALFSTSETGFIILTPDGKCLQSNQAALQMLGYKQEEIQRCTLTDIYLPANPVDTTNLLLKFKTESIDSINVEGIIIKKDSSLLKANILFTVIKETDGKPFVLLAAIKEDEGLVEKNQNHIKVLERTEEISKTGGWEYDIASKKFFWTRGVFAIYGLPVNNDSIDLKEAVGFYKDADQKKIRSAFIHAVKKGLAYDLELQFVSKDGTKKWVRTIGTPVLQNGKLVKVCGNIIDISSQKKLETELRESEEKFSKTFRNAPVIVTLTRSNDSTFLDVNQKFLEISGYELHEVIGKKSTDLGWVLPEDRKKVMELLKLHKKIENREVTVFSKTKKPHVCLFNAEEIIIDSQALLLVTAIDICSRKQTENALRESEERFKLLFDQAPMGYQSLDLEGNFIEVNQQWLSMLGYSHQEVIGRWFGDFLTPEYREAFRERFSVFKAQGQIHSEFEMMHKNGIRLFIAFEGKIGYQTDGSFKQTHCILQDITLQKASEIKIRESEHRFRILFENSPVAYQSLSEKGNYLDANENLCKMLGYTLEELKNKKFGDLWASETKHLFPLNFTLFLKKGYISTELNLVAKDRKNIAVWIEGRVEKDLNGKPIRTHCILHDITRLKHSEEILRASEEKYRLLFENISQGFALHEIITDIHGKPSDYRFLTINPAFETLTGLKVAELLGKRVTRVLPETEKYWIETYGRVALTGKPVRFENYSSALGKYFDVWAFSPKKRQFAAIFTDITEQKKADQNLKASEQKYRELANSLPVGVFETDLNGHVTFANQTLLHWFDTSIDNVIPDGNFIPFFDASCAQRALEKFSNLISQNDTSTGEYLLRRKNGTTFPVIITSFRYTENEKPKGLRGTVVDISDQKKFEAELEKKNRKLQFLNTMSLELSGMSTIENIPAFLIKQLAGYTASPIVLFSGFNPEGSFFITEHVEAKEDLLIKLNSLLPNGFSGQQSPINLSETVFNELTNNVVSRHESLTHASFGAIPPETDLLFKEITGTNRFIGISYVFAGELFGISLLGISPYQEDPAADLLESFAHLAAISLKRRKVEEKLKESEENFRVLIENQGEGVGILDFNEKFVFANPAAGQIFGLPVNQLIGRDLKEFVDPEHIPQVMQETQNRSQLMTTSYELEIKDAGKQEKTILVTATPQLDKNGNLTGTFGVFRDISFRKKMENDLRESENKFRQLAENIDEVFWLRTEKEMLYISPAFEKVWGVSREEIYRDPEMFRKSIHPADKARVFEIFHSTEFKNKGLFNDEYRIVRPDGDTRWIKAKSFPIFDKNGKIERRVGLAADITQKKEDEIALRKLSRAIEQSPAFIIVTDTKGNIEYVNPQFTKITGYSFDEVKGKNPRILQSGNTSKADYEKLWQTIGNGKTWQGEFCNRKKNGELYFEAASISPVFDDKGSISHYVAVKEDITDRKETEHRIFKAIIEAEERERNHFSRELHDGLGPLLSSIKMYFQWLADNTNPETKKEITERGLNTFIQAFETIREISNHLSPRLLSNFGIVSALRHFVDGINNAEKIKINFQTNFSNRLDQNLETTLFRISTELINNTLKHAHASQVEILMLLDTENKKINYFYSDNGQGFDNVACLTKPTGYGLTNIIQRVNNVQGKIQIASEPGDGMEVVAEFPVVILSAEV